MDATLDMQTLFQMLMTLTTELQQARTEIANLKEQLNVKQQHQPPSVSPITLEDDFPTLPVSEYQSASWHQSQKVLSLAQIVSKNQEKREATAARFFQVPSTTQALVHIRGPAKFAVARFFAHKSWITKTQLEVLATDPYFAHSKNPDTENNASVGSAKSSMEEDDPLTTSSQ
ncbi:hypothetical protein G6F61_012819 [Rhizopus arrhizus]|nr:hypothetical protein G6F61_012819 [Rhizopus arrhizus]